MMQDDFPIVPKPYKRIGDFLWMDEVSVISRVVKMMQDGKIRYVGPYFNSAKLGYSGQLMAINVPEDKIEAAANAINKYDEITHNYLRAGEPNIWFTLMTPNEKRAEEIIEAIKKELAIDEILSFKSKKTFKIKVNPA